MTFTDNQTWFTILLVIHVFFAIAGIGPSFAFAVMGPMAAKNPEGALWIVRAMSKVENATVKPVAWTIQWISGTLLIFNRSAIRSNFWKEEWLVIAIVLYAIILVISILNEKDLHAMIAHMEAGTAGTREFGASAKRTAMFGQIMTLFTVVIIILMVWKPLSQCVGTVLRC